MSFGRALRVAAACGLVPVLPVLARAWIHYSTRSRIHRSASELSALPLPAPPEAVAVIPGCLPLPDGTPSPMLADRLAAGLELYRLGLVTNILISGNAHHPRGDETAAMQRWLWDRDVDPSALIVDPSARRTWDTMHQAVARFGLRRVTVCTQRFHLPRALYLAQRAGLDALGLEADRRRYARGHLDSLRELAAQTAAIVDTVV